MLAFDPTDPFPLVPEGSHSYREAQKHSEAVDSWLGLRTVQTEEQVRARGSDESPQTRDQELWIGLPIQSLLTPYTEIRQILALVDPQPGQTVIDLGAGYGRMGFVIGHHYPQARFIGIECVQERVLEAQRCLARWNFPRVEMRIADLTDPKFTLPSADFYFLYDFGTRDAIEETLQDLRRTAQERAITVVGRGRSSRDAIEREHPWLSQVISPEHHSNYSIYRSRH